jgi:hypothetical protein
MLLLLLFVVVVDDVSFFSERSGVGPQYEQAQSDGRVALLRRGTLVLPAQGAGWVPAAALHLHCRSRSVRVLRGGQQQTPQNRVAQTVCCVAC